ncbi:MAG: transcriptional regulator PpsR [Gammaproteobacteria bacterium]
MEAVVSNVAPRQFKAPRQSLGELDTEAAATLITAANDVALVVDGKGVIRDLAFGSEETSIEGYGTWLGQPWTETVTIESRPKIEAILRDAAAKTTTAKWRQVNHPSSRGADVPVLYSAVRIGDQGRVVAIGRDMRPIAALQQRLVDAQQSMERDYSRLRSAETRYRLLFQIASEAVLIVDASSRKITEANPAALKLLGEDAKHLVGLTFPRGFDAESTIALQSLLTAVRASGRADDVHARLVEGTRELIVTATLFRQDSSAHFLIRLSPSKGDVTASLPAPASSLLEAIERSPDGFVVTRPDGRILSANRAFLDLAQLVTEEQARDESLERWLGRRGVDNNVLTAALQQHGAVRLYATTLRGEYGLVTEVEISAVSVPDSEHPCLGFTIRNVARRLQAAPRSPRALPRSVEQLAELVGRVALKDLVRESTDIIERLCIEAALELTGDNRASAAEMLGLSRQSLYVKLRRHGLGDLTTETEK